MVNKSTISMEKVKSRSIHENKSAIINKDVNKTANDS